MGKRVNKDLTCIRTPNKKNLSNGFCSLVFKQRVYFSFSLQNNLVTHRHSVKCSRCVVCYHLFRSTAEKSTSYFKKQDWVSLTWMHLIYLNCYFPSNGQYSSQWLTRCSNQYHHAHTHTLRSQLTQPVSCLAAS